MTWSDAARRAAAEARKRKQRIPLPYGYSVSRTEFAHELRSSRSHISKVVKAAGSGEKVGLFGRGGMNNAARGLAQASSVVRARTAKVLNEVAALKRRR